jgi:hypothetical protein
LQCGAELSANLGFAGGEARIARCLLLGSQCGLALRFLGSLTGELRLGAHARSKGLGLALSFSCQTGDLTLADPDFPRLDHSLPRSLPCENSRIISCRARPEPGEGGLTCLGSGLEAIDELDSFELTHVHSFISITAGPDGEKQMKSLLRERLRYSSS